MKGWVLLGFLFFFSAGAGSPAWAELGTLRESQSTQRDREGVGVKSQSKGGARTKNYYRADYPQMSNQVAGSSYKLGRGLINLVSSPFELPLTVQNEYREGGLVKSCTRGVGKGIARIFGRIGASVYDIATFPARHSAQPLMEPEFVLNVEKGEPS